MKKKYIIWKNILPINIQFKGVLAGNISKYRIKYFLLEQSMSIIYTAKQLILKVFFFYYPCRPAKGFLIST